MKKILGLSIIALVLIGLVAGGTFAYFSDTQTSTGNTFTAGTLVFNIQDPIAEGHQVFDVTNMKPGDVETRYLVVVNDGTLDMKWRAWLSADAVGTLDDELDISWTLKPTTYPSSSYSALASAGYALAGPTGMDHPIMSWTSIAELTGQATTKMLWASPGAIAFAPDQAAVFKIEVRMHTDATDQGTTYTGVLNFYATQYEIATWPAEFNP